jgi:type VI protein secretion system component VasF
MTNTQHTPGPWSSDTDAYVVNNSDEVLADVFYVESHSPDLDPRLIRKANARLIAAAPELLAALQALVALPNKHRPEEMWEAARAAIAKATGGQS